VSPIYVEISPSGGCNHRCTFCATAFIGYVSRFLDADLLTKRLSEMAASGVKSVMYAGAGEPLLHRRLGEVIAHGKREGIAQALTTNGIALTERFLDEALPSLTWIKVSINAGTEETYAKIHRTGVLDWGRLWNNLWRAVKRGQPCTIGAQMVVLPENADSMAALAQRCRDVGLDYLVLKPYSHQVKTPTPYEGLSYERFKHRLAYAEAMTTKTFQVIVRREAAQRVTSADRGYDRCCATGNFWAYLEADWNLYSCSAYVGDERFCMGNLRAQTFPEIWNSERRRRHAIWVRDELDITECRKACRMQNVNAYLWRVSHPQPHDAFP
jgi:radical SAM protein with 4Fe4S-binding SPASM domain